MTGKVKIMRGDAWAARLKEQLAQSPVGAAEWMEDHTQILGSDIDSQSGLLRIDEQLCYLKLYRFRSLRDKIKTRLGASLPLRHFKTALKLAEKGVSVPKPLACLRVQQGVVLATEGLSGGDNLAELFRRHLPETETTDEALNVMRCVGDSLAKLHVANYAYGDCRWNNLFWDGQRIYLIGFAHTRKGALGSVYQARDLARFTAHAEEFNIGSELYEQFLEAYLLGVAGDRREVVERMVPILYKFRGQHLARYGQRLV